MKTDIKLISKLAKTEVLSLDIKKDELTLEVQKMSNELNAQNIFVIMLFVHFSRNVEQENIFHLYKLVYERLLCLEEKESLNDPDVILHLDVIYQIANYILKVGMQDILLEDFLSANENAYKFKIINNIMKNKHFCAESVLLPKIFEKSKSFLSALKESSKHSIINNEVSWKKQGSGAKEIKRAQCLESEILKLGIDFCCIFFKKHMDTKHCEFTFEIFFRDEDFILSERLMIMKELNEIFNQVPSIIQDPKYWSDIKKGLSDLDNYCRKLALSILQQNIHLYQSKEKDFEKMWSIWFDVYDTLDSFSSHLTKAIWERTEIFYAYIKSNLNPSHPLNDFKSWLHVLNTRALTHENVNIKKYIQKEILQREYVTPQMSEFIFHDLLVQLNTGLILRDSNAFTQFSQKNELIITFYQNFFKNESVNLALDIQSLLQGLVNLIDHPQLIVSILKILSLQYDNIECIGLPELQNISKIIDNFKPELLFSNRYLSYKFILQMMTLYLKIDEFNLSQEMQTIFLKIVGQMPFELFSASDAIIYTDQEGLEYAAFLIEKVGKVQVESMVKSYLHDIFQVKATLQAIPKFQGSQYISIIKGLVKILLILDTKYEDLNADWFQEVMSVNLEIMYGQILTSSYISPEVIDQKIICYTHIFNDLLKFSSTQKHRDTIIYQIKLGAHLFLERIENSLLVPLSLYSSPGYITTFSDLSKLQSAFSNLSSFSNYLGMIVRVFHIYICKYNQVSHQILEKTIKLILGQVLKISQISEVTGSSIFNNLGEKSSNMGVFLWQYTAYELLYSVLRSYSEGIQENIKRKIDHLLIPDDIFVMGKSIVMNLAEFKNVKFDKKAEIPEDLERMMIDSDLNVKKVQNYADFDSWAIIAEFLKLFRFDEGLQSEVQMVLYPQIVEKAKEYLNDNMNADSCQQSAGCRAQGSNWTKEEGQYNQVIYGLLKMTYLPLVTNQVSIETITAYQEVCKKCWDNLKSLRNVFELQALQEFVEFAFSENLLEVLMNFKEDKNIMEKICGFNRALTKDIYDYSNQHWLILRTTFNHLMITFSQRPYLMVFGFENFIVNFTLCREIRSLDSQIHLNRIETLIPEVFTKKYENLAMEEISYQGAYVRCMTLLAIESMIQNVLTQINCRAVQDVYQDQRIQSILESIEQCIMQLFKVNQKIEKSSQSEMPYSQQHREKLRIWQSLLVFLQLLDPTIYTVEFRQVRSSISGFDIIDSINELLWSTIKQSHIPSIRQYIEIFTISFCLSFPEVTICGPSFMATLLDPNVKPQVSSSYLMIAGYCMVNAEGQDDSGTTQLKKKIFQGMIGFCTSNSAHARCMAQYFVKKMFEDPIFRPFIPQGLEEILAYFEKAKDKVKLMKKYDEMIKDYSKLIQDKGMKNVLSVQIDSYGEFIQKPFTETMKALTAEIMSEIRNADHFLGERDEYWMKELEFRKDEQISSAATSQNREDGGSAAVQDTVQNYQKKVLPWEQLEHEKDKLKRLFENRQRNEVIICASLIDKAPNLAGLTRTCEIMNAQALVINNKEVTRTDEFKTIAVTAEKWLPIYEVQVSNLYKYLEYQKSNGYTILGLEQTAASVPLNDFFFPSKCILLLGKEKEGIPQEYLGILDNCIEIPQFGIVRSLNVHVSGALCLWEYTKQQFK